MIRIALAHLQMVSLNRPPGYSEDVISRGTIKGDLLLLEESVYRELCQRYRPPNSAPVATGLRPVPHISAIRQSDWPLWAKALKRFARPEDRGLGDVLHRTIGPENSDAFKAWYKRLFKKDCGCGGRQALYNRLYPLNNNAST